MRRSRSMRAVSALLACAASIASAAAQSQQDQVSWSDAKGEVRVARGIVEENSLARVVVVEKERERVLAPLDVVGIAFGDAPAAYGDAASYLERGDFENAAAKFEAAAGDGTVREVVRAAARLAAARAWMRRG